MLRRIPLRRGRIPVGAAARRRIAAGGPRAKGRSALSLDAYRALVARLAERARHRCECCGATAGPLDPDHVVKRSQGGPPESLEALVYLCRACHAMKDRSFTRGRLVITRLVGLEYARPQRYGFSFQMHYGPHKRQIEHIEQLRILWFSREGGD